MNARKLALVLPVVYHPALALFLKIN